MPNKIYTLNGYRPVERDVNTDVDPENQKVKPESQVVLETDNVSDAATAFVDGGFMDGGLWVTVDSVIVRDDDDKDKNQDALVDVMQRKTKEKKERAEREGSVDLSNTEAQTLRVDDDEDISKSAS